MGMSDRDHREQMQRASGIPLHAYLPSSREDDVEIDAESLRDSLHDFERWIPHTSFDTADIRPVDSRTFRQFLLVQPQQLPVAANSSTKMNGEIHCTEANGGDEYQSTDY
jgi:hypothetical protein